MLKGKHILLGVTGGIAAYKACELASALVKKGCDVNVVMTRNATEFVTPLTFDALTHNRTVIDTFDRQHSYEIEHISLADKADLAIVAPASADIIAKLANGLADDMLTTTLLACTCPKICAPAMNTHMYENPATQRNLKQLEEDSWELLEPDAGVLACGAVGNGRLVSPDRMVEAIEHCIGHEKDLSGLSVLVTAGPTQEPVDPVRYLTNHSSGKMGYAIAKAAAARGAEVTLVTGKTSLPRPSYMEVVEITTAADMYEAVTSRSEKQDIIIKAAAVADFRPAAVADQKIKKFSVDGAPSIALEKTADILAFLGEHKSPGQTLCGFSMETEHMVENSRAKLEKKNLDLIAANNVKEQGAGFAVDTNVLTLISKEKEKQLPLMSKEEAADALLDEILTLRKK